MTLTRRGSRYCNQPELNFVTLRRSFVLRQAARGSKIDKNNRAVPGGAWMGDLRSGLET